MRLQVPVFEKKLFSMCTDDVMAHVSSLPNRPTDIVLFGIEAHVCVTQVCVSKRPYFIQTWLGFLSGYGLRLREAIPCLRCGEMNRSKKLLRGSKRLVVPRVALLVSHCQGSCSAPRLPGVFTLPPSRRLSSPNGSCLQVEWSSVAHARGGVFWARRVLSTMTPSCHFNATRGVPGFFLNGLASQTPLADMPGFVGARLWSPHRLRRRIEPKVSPRTPRPERRLGPDRTKQALYFLFYWDLHTASSAASQYSGATGSLSFPSGYLAHPLDETARYLRLRCLIQALFRWLC